VVVTDATCLERNLALVLQILELTGQAVICANLMDEACRLSIHLDLEALSEELGVPVVATVARTGQGLEGLVSTIDAVATGARPTSPRPIDYGPTIEQAILRVLPVVKPLAYRGLDERWLALRLLEAGPAFLQFLDRNTLRG